MVQISTPGVTPNRGMGPPWDAFCQITLTSCCILPEIRRFFFERYADDLKDLSIDLAVISKDLRLGDT